MPTRHDDLRDELVAILGAGRELTADADAQLADAFVHFLERRQAADLAPALPGQTAHQPHYSLYLAGGMWGAAGMFLLLLLLLGTPTAGQFIVASVVVLSLIAALSRALLFMARHGWRLPHVHVTVSGEADTLR